MRNIDGWLWRPWTPTVRRAHWIVGLLLLLIASQVLAATYCVNVCTNDGTGSSCTCAGSPGGAGAFNNLQSGANALSNPGDILNVKAGTYHKDTVLLSGKSGTSASPIIIQANGWTSVGTGETAILDAALGSSEATQSWTQCSGTDGNCNCGPSSQAQTIGSGGGGSSQCTATWYFTTGTNPFQLCVGAQNADGSPTFRVATTAALTNGHTYLTGRCSGETWRPCSATADCLNGETCSGSTAEHDSTCVGADLLVRWNLTPGANQRVYTSNEGTRLQIRNSNWVTVRGLTVLGGRRQGLAVDSNSTNIVFNDNQIAYSFDNGNGSGYGAWFAESTPVTFQNSEIGWTSDEGIHTTTACKASDCLSSGNPCSCCTAAGAGANCKGATALTISNNWIHDTGDATVMGLTHIGTPSGLICSQPKEPAHTAGPGDYTGTTFSGNLVQRVNSGSSVGKGIILESNCSNWTISDNIFQSTAGSCLRFAPADATGHATDNHNIYNNLFLSCGDHAIDYSLAANTSASSNQIWNNTCVGAATDCIGPNGSFTGTTASNVIANNIFYNSGSQKVVNWSNTTTSNVFKNNLVKTSGSPAITWLNVNYNNSDIDGTATACGSKCPSSKTGDPLFTNTSTSNYHIQTTSPAKDAGTSTGMPSGHTRDINNSVASSHTTAVAGSAFPSYADNQAIAGGVWDIGMDEFSTGGTVTLTISKTDSPDPVVAGNQLTYTLAYQNTGGGSATGVTITDDIPANTTFVSATGGGTSNGTTVTWSIGTVAAGVSGSVQMVVGVVSPLADGTIITNSTYAIISNETTSVSGVADTTTVTSLPVIQLSMSDAPDPVLAGSNITYTIFYSNTGTAGATNVVITDAVPVNTTFVSATNSGSNSGGTVTWNIGPVNAGSFGSVQMVVTASSGLANGAVVTNSTYTLASSELSTINGTPINTSVIALVTSIPQPKFPITSRQNGWVQTQTLLFDGASDVIQTPNGGQWIRGQASELLTLSVIAATTDTSANLLPANSIIEAVVARVTTTITTAVNWKLGDGTQAARFTSANSTMTAGTTDVGLNQMNPTVATADLGPVQTTAAKVRVTCNATPGAGAVRITVFYRQFIPPTN